MARIRTLKPGFFRSRSLAKCDPLARLTFAGMWTEADDHGRGVADPRLIKGAIWPLDDDITHLHVSAHIDMLAATGHVILYRVAEETYFQVLNWEPHQSAAFRRGTPQYPEVSAGQIIDSINAPVCMQESASSTQGSAGTGNREQGTGKGTGNSAPQAERETSSKSRAPKPGSDDDPDWLKFWAAYPKKAAKEGARKSWAKAVKIADPADIIAGAERYSSDPNRSPQYTKDPTTWLNNGCWDDEPLPPRGGNTYQPYQDPAPADYHGAI